MRLPIVLLPDAKREYDDAHDRYRLARKGLGTRFRAAVNTCISSIQRFPLAKSVVHSPDVRRAIVSGFPYLIIYRVAGDSIRIISIFHTSRDPSAWQKAADADSSED